MNKDRTAHENTFDALMEAASKDKDTDVRKMAASAFWTFWVKAQLPRSRPKSGCYPEKNS